MNRIRRIIREVHRRSIWQVLAVYLAGSWVALQVVDALTRTAGLPDWVPPFAIVLLVIGLPVVLGTAIVQEGAPVGGGREAPSSSEPAVGPSSAMDEAPPTPGSETAHATAPAHASGPPGGESFLQQHLTWKRAILGGVAAFVLLGVAVGSYFAMRVTGVGPVASLVAQGVLDERDPILMADFGNLTDDPTLGGMVTELLRVDLTRSQVVTLMEAARLEDALRRAGRDPAEPLTPAVARELAVRDGIKAYLEGEVGRVGNAFVLTATLRRGEDGGSLATFRRTARDGDALIDSIDRLSQDIRERVGESLRSIRQGEPLSQVTTSSIEALRRFTEAEEELRRGNEMAGLALLREATAVDSAFAMAYRREATVLGNLRIERDRQIEAVERAFRHRNRLTEVERHLTEALYHNVVTGDDDAVVRAYEAVLRVAPEDVPALNNLANEYQRRGELDRAEALYRRAIAAPEASPIPYQNLVRNRLQQGDPEGARAVAAAYLETFPDDVRALEVSALAEFMAGNPAEAERILEDLAGRPSLPPTRLADAHAFRSWVAASEGRMGDARDLLGRSLQAASQVGPAMEAFYMVIFAHAERAVARDRGRVVTSLQRVREVWPDDLPYDAFHWGILLGILAQGGLHEEGLEWLREWAAGTPAEGPARQIRAEQRFFETWMLTPDDPEAGLAALDVYRREARCGRCYEPVRADLLEEAGRTAEARDAWLGMVDRLLPQWGVSVFTLPLALERYAALSEEVGDTAAAVEAYRRFIDLWSEADPELQPRVEVARARLAALGRSPTS
jgi:eukaryotic-like serine/threonine-protein kinase